MLAFKYLLLLSIAYLIKGKEESQDEFPVYSELNGFETIYSNQNFIIETDVESMACFDTYDKNSVIYISKSKKIFDSKKDERITGKFYKIEPNIKYYIRNSLYFGNKYPSVFQKYLFPLDLKYKEIDLSENSINYLYLRKDTTYEFNYKDSSITKIIKLSRKTLDAEVIITVNNQKNELNKNSLYYFMPEKFKGKFSVKVNENDAFIEFLTKVQNSQNYAFNLNEEEDKYEISKSTINIIIKYTQKDFFLQLSSDKKFEFSFAYGFSVDNNYFYNSGSNNLIDSYREKDYYSNEIQLYSIFKNINLLKDEYFSFTVKIKKSESEQKIILHYYKTSQEIINSLLNENVDNSYTNSVITNLKILTDAYIYSDIAQSPPEISGFENYHHGKINLKTALDNIEQNNRNFYEFYQDIQLVLNHVKDLHFHIFSDNSPKNNKLARYFAVLPFNFKIDKYNDDYRIFIKKNEYLENYPEKKKFYFGQDKYSFKKY